MNQCDGCRRKIPVDPDNNIHFEFVGKYLTAYMICTAERYKDDKNKEPTNNSNKISGRD